MHLEFKGLWRHKDFMKLWAGQTVSELGSRITRDGLPLTAVLFLGATPAQMGLLAAVGSAPVLLLALAAGAWVDRMRRRPVMVAADLGRALLLLTIPLAALAGRLSMAQLYIILALTGILTVFFDVAYQSYLPSLVSREHIVEGNSKLALSGSTAEVLGPGLTGVLVQALSGPVAIFFDALSFLFSAGSVAAIRQAEPPPAPPEKRQPLLEEVREGLSLVFKDPVLRAFALNSGTRNFFGNFIGTLYALYAIRVLGIGPAALGVTVAMGGLGDLLGALVVGGVVRRFGVGKTLVGSLLLAGGFTFLIPLARGPLLVAIALLAASQLFGDMLQTVFAINAMSLRQAATPDRLLGRMNASMQFMLAGLAPLGALAGGLLGETLGLRTTLFVAAGGILLSSLWVVFSPIPGVKGMGDWRSEPMLVNSDEGERGVG